MEALSSSTILGFFLWFFHKCLVGEKSRVLTRVPDVVLLAIMNHTQASVLSLCFDAAFGCLSQAHAPSSAHLSADEIHP